MILRFKVDKLIRDRLPAIMREQGLTVFDRPLEDSEFDTRLRDKLVEEALEARSAATLGELIDELADLREVMLALAEVNGVTEQDVEARRLAKRAERGGFDQRVYNAAVEGEDGLAAVAYYLARPLQYPQEER
jgi:predicted house-cleaning noncanonical NTP pyrophosphatase (MazG superfamily)